MRLNMNWDLAEEIEEADESDDPEVSAAVCSLKNTDINFIFGNTDRRDDKFTNSLGYGALYLVSLHSPS
ncbi:hypothetical protein KY285_014274 [Solanum tuberosum]|nr:hypothetical protein KY285_014274 [Solanum tuberosum]